ncbi:glycosyltransferase [Miltoncostaea oceani]|uniref:glycosyltransferase n=1 Tax=Miltoncostaea oceani TaxID=2843216 RepID=UPI001C3D074D|nr:glycosyltransferase [Miltoncostaea oceani]
MRIGLIAPAWIPIPPPAYGGIEHVVALLAGGLARAGHEVVLVAPPGSQVDGVRVVETTDELPPRIGLSWEEAMHLLPAMGEFEGCDVVIDHSGPFGAHLAAHAGPAAFHVVHCPLGLSERVVYEGLAAAAPELRFIAISEAQRRCAPALAFAGVCHNALDPSALPFSDVPGDHLVFLGRIAPGKGPGAAIEIARRLDMPLLIAAKCREDEEMEYFDRVVAPHVDDDRVRYLGELTGDEKFALLAGAAALVFPIDWEEPFGMVMIEAMACGTPVLATRRGAVPEVVLDGETGFVRDDVDGLVEAAASLGRIDRRRCRAHVEVRFSVEPFIRRYEEAIGTVHHAAVRHAAHRSLRPRPLRSLDAVDTTRGLVRR